MLEPDDMEGAPAGRTLNYRWASCPGRIPWVALRQIWKHEARCDDEGPHRWDSLGHVACPKCRGPLATCHFDGALFSGAFSRACWACVTSYCSGAHAPALSAWVHEHVGVFAPGPSPLPFGIGGRMAELSWDPADGPLTREKLAAMLTDQDSS